MNKTTETIKDVGMWVLGFALTSICWHFGGIDYTDKTPVSGLACFMSMLIGWLASLMRHGP